MSQSRDVPLANVESSTVTDSIDVAAGAALQALWILHTVDAPDAKLLEKSRRAFESLMQRQDVGFTKLAARENLIQAAEARAKEIARVSNHIVVVGMGGSSLGTRALLAAVPRPQGRGAVSFLDNIDADRFWTWLKSRNDIADIHWVLTSKSGNTVEILALADLIDQHLRQSGHRRLGTVATVISELKESPLTNWARKENVPVLEVPIDVGGRFSVLTAVGLFPAAFAGLRIERMTEGTAWALAQGDLVAQMAAHSLGSFLRDEWVTMLWSYADSLREFGLWWQQLWAESLAKRTTRNGEPAPRVSTPVPGVGTCDQHSMLQQIIEGAPDKFVWFQRIAKCEEAGPKLEKTLFEGQDFLIGKGVGELFKAEAEATEQAMREAKVHTIGLHGVELDERSMAALFMIWQLTVATMGEVLGVNAFNQPGVERGKVLARSALSRS
ncbi:glucose-6-phosphate isomerase [soil metagenome]